MPKKPIITSLVRELRATKNPLWLIKILYFVIKQQRTLELIYGGYCRLFYRPSPVFPCHEQSTLDWLLSEKKKLVIDELLSRQKLIEVYGASYRVALLPADFECARRQGICEEDQCLVIGEYGENSRIAYVTHEVCVVSEHYRHVPGVRHIHAIHRNGNPGEFLVTTGDGSKRLDLWSARDTEVRFVRGLKKRLAGFTAVVRVKDEFYFGTDFSSRPNFIVTLTGTKYFFPQKAYNRFVTDFYPYLDRYIVAMSCELAVAGGRKTVSIFDTTLRRFIYCEECSPEAEPSPLPLTLRPHET
jgi:hypothetical protein